MNNEQRLTWNLPSLALRRPLSFAVGALGGLVILFALYMRIRGAMYLEQLDYIDTFTPVMISILMLRGVYALRHDTDLQAVSISLIGALSFIFIYEALYKVSFYVVRPMPPTELREFVIQVGIALTAVAGFAFGKFHLSRWSRVFLITFVALYGFWMLIGYPQVDTGGNAYWVIIPVHFTWNMIYAVNRGTKVLMFFAYLFFYSKDKQKVEAPSTQALGEMASD